ncbi:uncharacterized protein LOC135129812 isoform X2 [Zophobas morio]|uniref:uncharacterized protein LOC135129812 isoform X2 n=1 Tax=Zophobas morio TaxID=2755281 RepID=UPI0030827C99
MKKIVKKALTKRYFVYCNNVTQASKLYFHMELQKVYRLLGIQLLFIIFVTYVSVSVSPIKYFMQENDWLLYTAQFVSMCLSFTLYIKRNDSPSNLVLLAAFTIIDAYIISATFTYYPKVLILTAFVITLVGLGSLTYYTLQMDDFLTTEQESMHFHFWSPSTNRIPVHCY